jgi:two-component sensor histidine kinase
MQTESGAAATTPERYLTSVLDEMTASGAARETCLEIVARAAKALAGADGFCLLPIGTDRCLLVLADGSGLYDCDVTDTKLYRAATAAHRPESLGTRVILGDEQFVGLSNGEEQRFGAVALIPLPATTGHAALGFFWREACTPDSAQMRSLQILAKATGLAACTWQKEDEFGLRLQHQRRVATDLQHRLRNNLALIRSIVRRSSETADSAEQFAVHLEGRIAALARTQGSLAAAGQAGVEFEDLVRTELIANAVPDARFLVHGPSVRLHSKGAETIALAIHELATNSLKFGALTAPNGYVAITWATERAAPPRLHVNWTESGVTIASLAPRKRGFGQELIESTLPYELNANTRLTFAPGGVQCLIDVPLDRRLTGSGQASLQLA